MSNNVKESSESEANVNAEKIKRDLNVEDIPLSEVQNEFSPKFTLKF